MTSRLAARLVPLAVAVVMAACGGGDDGSQSASMPTAPSPAPAPTPTPSPAPAPAPAPQGCDASVSGLPASVPGAAGRYQFTIGVGSTCAWTARTNVGWADVAPGSGNGNATPTLNVTSNETFFVRYLTVVVNGRSFDVTQGSVNCSYEVEPRQMEESSAGGTAWLTVKTADGCGWTVTASEGWIRVLTASGAGNATIYIELLPNPGDVRNAYLMVGGQRVDVRQRRRG